MAAMSRDQFTIVIVVLILCANAIGGSPTTTAPATAAATQPVRQDPTIPFYRPGPDGKPLAGFLAIHERHLKRAAEGPVDLLFLGDSITAAWSNRGKPAWDQHFAKHQAAAFGVSSDRTQQVLWRIDNGALDRIRPRLVVLLIGTNNVATGDPPDRIAAGVRTVLDRIHAKAPDARVLLMAIFPRAHQRDAGQPTETIRQTNALLAKLADGQRVRFLDIGPALLNPDGTFSKDIMPDYLHLSPDGYRRWAQAIAPTVEEMMKQK
jgi:lysophospholipase L1-like esterase